MIRFDGVTVFYARAKRPALDGVSFEARRGEITAVAGPNGSGKSTLVRTLIGAVRIAAGGVRLDGAALSMLGRRGVARRVAVVTQREPALFALRVDDYIALGRTPYEPLWGGRGRGDSAAVDRAVALAGVGALRDRSTAELSGGEWQRVRIARALAQGGEGLVLDEPTTFLDIAHEMETFELLDQLARQGHAVLIVSHQINLVARFAASIVLLHDGRVAASGSPGEVMLGATLERVYEWPLVVTRDPAIGAPALVPLRRARAV